MSGIVPAAQRALRLHAGHPQIASEWLDRYWVTEDGRRIRVADLTSSHLRNILCLILRRAAEGNKWVASRLVPGKLVFTPDDPTITRAGVWLVAKALRSAWGAGGYYRAARNLRKQGVSLDLALAILLGGKYAR